MRSRSTTPSSMAAPSEESFCDTCLRNQALHTHLLSEYLPDEDDAEYAKFLAAYDDYRIELEDRYPQVCSACLPRVQAQIDKAAYAARADHLRRIMDMSEQRRVTAHTWRQTGRLTIISLAKWCYVLSTVAGILWHTMALIMAPDDAAWADTTFRPVICFAQAIVVRSVDESCILSSHAVALMWAAIAADLFSCWWNPKLKAMTNVLTGKMVGLKSLWSIRLAVVALRSASLYYWQSTTVQSDSFMSFRRTNAAMLFVLLLGFVLTWKSIRIVYQSSTTLRRGPKTLLSAPSTPKKPTQDTHRTAYPDADVYSSMVHALAPAIQSPDDTAALPPSPTLTEASCTTRNTEATTPYFQRSAFLTTTQDEMDWTPTRRRFTSQEPQIIPNQWSQRGTTRSPSPPSQYAHREPVSLFSRPDPNPFRHRVPEAPKAPAHAKANPWRPGVWDPPLRDTMPGFFKKERRTQGSVGEAKGLDGIGVPRNVKRDSELFASPKMKFDFYGTQKETGLEDTFNGLFAK